MAQIPSTKPYLIRAIHEWCIDQGCTPYLAVVVDARTRVPHEYVKEGQIVLNLGPEATHQLMVGNELITFSARFNGVAQTLSIPIDNVAAIYARENGQGLTFEVVLSGDEEKVSTDPVPKDESPQQPSPSGHPHLTRIK